MIEPWYMISQRGRYIPVVLLIFCVAGTLCIDFVFMAVRA